MGLADDILKRAGSVPLKPKTPLHVVWHPQDKCFVVQMQYKGVLYKKHGIKTVEEAAEIARAKYAELVQLHGPKERK